MHTEAHELTVSGVRVAVARKAIKNLHLGVYPPDGRVRVAVPLAVSDEAVRIAVIRKLGWIRRQQARFQAQPRQSERRMLSGETHEFLGRSYRLRVVQADGPARIVLRSRSTMELHMRAGTEPEARARVLQEWYRRRLKELVPPLLEKWQPLLGVEAKAWGVRKMKTKWGSCSPEARRIWLNLELAKKPAYCLEYIVVHELIHLLERRHTERFFRLIDRFLPRWRAYREELNGSLLGHTVWE